MPKRPETVLFNAMHTTTGGGMTYLRGVLPELAKDDRFKWILLAPAKTLEGTWVPPQVEVKVAPELGFAKGHLWEQLVLPWQAWRWGAKTILCNANYAPLLAWRSVPVIHTTPRAAGQAQTAGMKLYWRVLKLLTRLSVWNAPRAYSVAHHVIADYASPRSARKVRVAPPAIASVKVEPTERDPNLVVAIGDFYAQKDYPLLVQAFAKLYAQRPASRLMIIGRPVDPRVRNEVLDLVRELKLSQAVTLTGGMPHDKLMQVLDRAAVFVNASKAECFNIPVLEALAHGVPVVLPDVDFQFEVADHAGVYVPVDKGGDVAAAFAVALYGVLENSVVAEALRKKGRERAKLFTWAATAKTIADGLAGAPRI
jgi:glycosyltransferase involved in cell wall biosynthesis